MTTATSTDCENPGLISVILPTFNYGRFLREALDSIFTQTYSQLEVIVVDDGSTDDTPKILQSISDPRLKHFRTPNGGISAARNFGLERATGEFVAFIDADDRWRPEKLERQVALLRQEPSVGTVFSNFVRFNEQGFMPADQFTFYPELPSVPTRDSADGRGRVILGDAFCELIRFGLFVLFRPVTFVRRNVIGNLRFPLTLKQGEDLFVTMMLYDRSGVGYIPEVLAEIRRHGRNTSESHFQNMFWQLKSLQFLERDVAPNHTQPVRARIGRMYASIGYHYFWQKHPWRAARHYLKCLAYPSHRLNALSHLAALPALLWLPRKETIEANSGDILDLDGGVGNRLS